MRLKMSCTKRVHVRNRLTVIDDLKCVARFTLHFESDGSIAVFLIAAWQASLECIRSLANDVRATPLRAFDPDGGQRVQWYPHWDKFEAVLGVRPPVVSEGSLNCEFRKPLFFGSLERRIRMQMGECR